MAKDEQTTPYTIKANHTLHYQEVLCFGPGIREVNNGLTGRTFAQLVNYFAHLVNSTCPLPKIALSVNYFAKRKSRHYDYYK